MTQMVSLRSFYAFKEVDFVFRVEEETQRYGRNKDTIVNSTYINSGEYRRKFNAISDNPELNQLLYQLAKKMLLHRSGTLYEDMYWIDLDTLKIVAQETNSKLESEIVYSQKTKEEILKCDNLITIHSHPNSFPPSPPDLYSNYFNRYLFGVVVCHNGDVFKYSVYEEISARYFDYVIADYLKEGYTERKAQIKALEELQGKFGFKVEEVKAMAHEIDNYRVPQECLDMTREEIKKELEHLSLEIEQKRTAGLIPSREIDEKYRKMLHL